MNKFEWDAALPRGIFMAARYEVVCSPSHHIHNNFHVYCILSRSSTYFPFKCFQIAPALHMLIPTRLMMRKAQIYRIQNLNIFYFCHGPHIPGAGSSDFPFSISNILGGTPGHQEFWNVYLNMSHTIEIYFKYVTVNWNISPTGSIGIDTKYDLLNFHLNI